MIGASKPRTRSERARLLVIDPSMGSFRHAEPSALAAALDPRDLLVVNDAATLPASFSVLGRDMEVRLVGRASGARAYRAVLFGSGDHRTKTEARPLPARVRPGERLTLGPGLEAVVARVDPESPRLAELAFALPESALTRALYRHGRPIQYAHVPERLAIWDVQNRFGARPWAFELASAGQILDGEVLLALARRGVGISTLTHAAGISSTGDPQLDARFPLPERYEIPASTASAIAATRALGGRVLAVGTTVVRALESAARGDGRTDWGPGEATLRLDARYRPAVADGIVSGMHEPGTSHYELLEAFAPRDLLDRALESAEDAGYLQHEFGDFCLIWPSRRKHERVRALDAA